MRNKNLTGMIGVLISLPLLLTSTICASAEENIVAVPGQSTVVDIEPSDTDTTRNFVIDMAEISSYADKTIVRCLKQNCTVKGDIKAAKVDGDPITSEDFSFTLEPSDKIQTITVTDSDDIVYTIKVQVNSEHIPRNDYYADCTAPVVCEVCETVLVPGKEHKMSDYYCSDEYGHYRECINEGCIYSEEPEPHITDEDDNDCTTPVLCKICGFAVVEAEIEHIFTYTPNGDEATHTAQCINCAYKEIQKCDLGMSICSQKPICFLCGSPYGEVEPGRHAGEIIYHEAKASTHTSEGNIAYYQCDSCHKCFIYGDNNAYKEIAEEDTIIPKTTEHTFSDWKTVKAPTCTQPGSEEAVCECGETASRETEPLGHVWDNEFTIDKQPTLTSDGVKSIHCKNCDAIKDETVIPKTAKPSSPETGVKTTPIAIPAAAFAVAAVALTVMKIKKHNR